MTLHRTVAITVVAVAVLVALYVSTKDAGSAQAILGKAALILGKA